VAKKLLKKPEKMKLRGSSQPVRKSAPKVMPKVIRKSPRKEVPKQVSGKKLSATEMDYSLRKAVDEDKPANMLKPNDLYMMAQMIKVLHDPAFKLQMPKVKDLTRGKNS
jgi:hypothetical protein